MTHLGHLVPWWLQAPLGTRIGENRARQRAQKHRKYGESATIDLIWGSNMNCKRRQTRGSIVVSISACHAEDPGSIPDRGAFC